MTIRKLRTIDLIIFFVIGAALDIVLGLYGLFGIKSYLSVSIPLILLAYIRWGKYALFSNLGIAIVHLFLYDVDFAVGMAHAIAMLSLAVALLILKMKSMQQTRIAFQYVVLYYTLAYVTMFFVEWILLIVFKHEVLLASQALNHFFNFILGLGLLAIIAMQKELLVRMDPYLREKSEENHKHEQGN